MDHAGKPQSQGAHRIPSIHEEHLHQEKQMKIKKPLYLKIEIDGYQEDQIVAVSIAESFKRLKSTPDEHAHIEDQEALLKAFQTVFHYYTGKILK